MKMDKKQYQNLLAPLPAGVLDGLRRMIEFVDKALAREHRRDIRLKEDGFWNDNGFDAALFGEAMSDKSCTGAKEVQKSLTSDWHIFTNDLKGALHLHHDNYIALKTAGVGDFKGWCGVPAIWRRAPYSHCRCEKQSGKIAALTW